MSYKITLEIKDLNQIAKGKIKLSDAKILDIEKVRHKGIVQLLEDATKDQELYWEKELLDIYGLTNESNKREGAGNSTSEKISRIMVLEKGWHYGCISNFSQEIKKGHTLKITSFDYDCNTILFRNKTTGQNVTLCRLLFTTEFFKQI